MQQVRYLATVLASAAAVAVIGGASAYSGHHGADLKDLLARTLIVMVGVGLPGGWLLFRPVARFLAAPAGRAPPAAAIRRLPVLTALWVAALAGTTIAGHLAATHGSWAAMVADGPDTVAAMLAHVGLFATYIALSAYFLMKEYVSDLRAELWERGGIGIAPGNGRLATRLGVGFAAVAAGPALLIFSDARAAVEPDTHAFLRQALELDVLALALFSAVLIMLVARGLARPVTNIVSVMEAVDRGHLHARAAVLTDDELGLLTARFNAMLDGLAERRRMEGTFSRFVPEGIADMLLRNEGALAPQEREASVIYTDIERFTDITATLEPREVLEMLNAYFESVAEAIQRHGGVITQFQGDAVLAVFNFPLPQREYAPRALAAAWEVAALENVRAAEKSRLRTRVGVATGRVVAGTVGGGDRLGYTVHGATVNLAARLEELNKHFGSRVLCDGRTAELSGAGALRDRGPIGVRGFAGPVRVFELDRAPPQSTPLNAGVHA